MGRSDVQDGVLMVFRGDGRVAYRIVRRSVPSEADWRSHYELGRLPRGVEVGSALNHMSLSMFTSAARAVAVNDRFNRRLGEFVAAVRLHGEYGVWFAETGAEGHLAVWGRPPDLQRSVEEVERA